MSQPDSNASEHTRPVQIPERTASAISQRLWMTEFESVDAYVAFALDQVLRELDRVDGEDKADDGSSETDTEDTVDDAEPGGATDEAVASRLESLGYL